ncbi:MAG: aromatic ring-hydroxylating dioxygenase subunit alpha [Alphaproteobacteria bacterium]
MTSAVNATKSNGFISKLLAEQPAGHALNQAFYADPDVYTQDVERVFMREWFYVGQASQIAETGDYFVFEIAGESIIIVRGEDGDIRALVNVCRHRGSRVCYEASGNTRWFACPYHGWTYDLDGSLAAARQMPKAFDKSSHGLKQIHCHDFHGMILINFADEPASLDDAHRELDDLLAPFQLERTKIAYRESYRIESNWKLAIENYRECYHCAPAHPEFAQSHSIEKPWARTSKLMDQMRPKSEAAGVSVEDVSCQGWLKDSAGFAYGYDRYPLYKGYLTGSEDGQPVAPLMGDLKSFDGGASDLQLGMFSYFLFYSDHGVVYRFTPLGVRLTECEIIWLVRDDAEEGKDYDVDRMKWLWDVTTVADKTIIENNQKGVNSRYYVPGPYAPMEDWCGYLVDWYFERLALE